MRIPASAGDDIVSSLLKDRAVFLKLVQFYELKLRQPTFTFTIDCLPAYTKFNKKKKVMAVLQVVDKTDTTHNYKNTAVRGHENRTKDSDVDSWYTKSVFAGE